MIQIFFSSINKPLAELDKPKPGCLIYVVAPSHDDLKKLETDHGLDPDLVRDGLDNNEAPRIEQWEDRTYLYTRYVLPEIEKQTTAPVLVIFGIDMLYIICRRPYEGMEKILSGGKLTTSKRAQTLLQILSDINFEYKIRINNVAKRIWQVRSKLDKAHIANKDFVSFIDIEEDLNDFLLALEPMNAGLNSLLTGKFIRLYEDDKDLMEDLELSSEELIRLASSQLKTIRNIREAYSTIAANNLNRVLKLMTGITILIGTSTLVTGLYGMNVKLPGDHHAAAFWFIIGGLGGLMLIGAAYFKRNRWF